MNRRLYITTFGCQMNDRDSEVIYGLMMDRGWQRADSAGDADCILINTCSVRRHAEERAYSNMGMLAKLKKKKPHLVLGFVGCTAEKDKDIVFERLPHVDLVVGPSNIYEIPDCVENAISGQKNILAVGKKTRPEHGNPDYHEDKNRVYISISEGCDNYCSYCIVPYVRGRQRSRPSGALLNEIKLAAKSGINEIILLGQNVNSYGNDLGGGYTFVELLGDIAGIEGVKRIRFVTCHPKDTKEKLSRAMRNIEKVHKHLHLPLRSGSAKILKAMNRGYAPAHYTALVDKLRQYIPECNITTDIIVGFPGETDKDFKDTMDMMKKIEFDSAYIFKYSPRPPARSAAMIDDVPEDVKKKRHAILLEAQKNISRKKAKRHLPMAAVFLSVLMATGAVYAGTSMFERGPEEKRREERSAAVGVPNAEAAFVKGDYEEALRIGRAYLSRRPKNSEKIECLMGRALLKLKRLNEARDYFLKVAENSRDKKFLAEANLGIADSYYLDGEYRQARDYYEKVARAYPDADNMNIVYYRLGECYSKLDNESTSKEYYDKLMRLYPDSIEAKLLKGEGSGAITYSVQVGAFTRMENAEGLKAELKTKGFDANIQTVTVDNACFYRVKVGDYSRIRDAEDMARNLQNKGYTTKVCP